MKKFIFLFAFLLSSGLFVSCTTDEYASSDTLYEQSSDDDGEVNGDPDEDNGNN